MNIIEQNKEKINGILSTFDRMLVNGYILQLQSPQQFQYYLIQNNVQLKDFKDFAEMQTSLLCNHIDDYIKANNIKHQYLTKPNTNKDELARIEWEKDIHKTGPIAAFSAVEVCKTMTVVPNHVKKKLEITSKSTKCKHYYIYLNDIEFGWMFIKIQTWFPYNVQIYINGHEYLRKRLEKNNIKYEMFNNSFSFLEDFDKAQKLADGILNEKISNSFDGLIKQINPILSNIKEKIDKTYYWCIEQCEFATDINFKKREDLSLFYKKLVETSYFTFSNEDIYSFFGRNLSRMHNFTKGEITSDLRNRYQGYRIKFKINENQIKMYDKLNNLRIEVTINNPKDFKTVKEKEKIIEHKKIEKIKEWVPMGKSISNLYRYIEISKNITKRYIDALPDIDIGNKVPISDIKELSSSITINERKYSGFNILSEDTLNLLSIISNGKYLINGFTNKQIRIDYFNSEITKKDINKMTRLLAKLRAHGIIKKVPRKTKYYLTTKGRNIINSILFYTRKELLNN